MMQQNAIRVDAKQLATYFDPPPALRTIRNWTKERRVPFVKIGNKVYFDVPKVMAHLEAKTVKPR